jgi:hypothetical protein
VYPGSVIAWFQVSWQQTVVPVPWHKEDENHREMPTAIWPKAIRHL